MKATLQAPMPIPPLLRLPLKSLLPVLLTLSACTAVEYARTPQMRNAGEVFLTQESLKQPYQSMGLVQITRKGVRIFGFIDPAGTDMSSVLSQLEGEVRRAGADGAMNVRVVGTPVHTATKILGLLLFFAPFPTEMTVTAEMVRLPPTAALQPNADPSRPGLP